MACSTIQEYLTAVEEQIRWKRAGPVVALELKGHLEDQRDAFAEEGSTPEEAERLAMEEMGDPVSVGTELDRIHRPRPSWGIFIPALLSLAVWLGFRVFQHWGVSALTGYYFPRWGGTLALALGVMALLYFLDYTFLGKRPLLAAMLLTAAVFGRPLLEITMDYPLDVGDYLPLLLPLAMALSIYALREKGSRGLAACCALGLAPALPWIALGWVQMLWPTLLCGTALLALAVKSGWFGGQKRNWLLVAGYALAALGAILLALTVLADGAPYSLIDAVLRAQGGNDDYIIWQKQYVRELVSNAGLVDMADIPEGVENPAQWLEDLRWLLRYEMYDGMLLAILANFGWLAFLAVQAPMAVLLAVGWRKCRRQTAALGRLLAAAILLTLTWQAAAYVIQTLTGLLGYQGLLTPFPYPLISDGGTALAADCALLGLLASVFRNGSIVREDSRRRSYIPRETT
ncbi:permease prefix domain 1-containing protein [uncultured Dysosmobacter sp.]|uniref:permease prefix domain 1-containing protein n=1 Tax=uncultured Dysosmobacter sp. TaxID=2591384 RepID=UPI0026270F2F|nr:permease prefix domain 1-containing protein [uncultured Dysosmobacter sp.]